MNRATIVLLTLPAASMALTVALEILSDRVSLTVLWVLFGISVATSLACGFRAVVLLRGGRPGGYVCGVAAMLYLVLLLCAVGAPPKVMAGIQPAGWSEREAAAWLRDKSNIIGGRLPPLMLVSSHA